MMYVHFTLSLRNVEGLLFERGIDVGHETARIWWNGTVKATGQRLSYLVRCRIRRLLFVFNPNLIARCLDRGVHILRSVADGGQTTPILLQLTVPFDLMLTELGLSSLLTEAGIVLIYKGANHFESGADGIPSGAYQPG